MPQLSKTRLNTAITDKSHLSLDYHHVTTSDFMLMRPIFYRHCMPLEHGKINMMAQMRLQPLAVPTYGRAKANIRTFWVPYRTIMQNWNEFIGDSVSFQSTDNTVGLVSSVPFVMSNVILSFFRNSGLIVNGSLQLLSEAAGSGEPYDFQDMEGNNRKFTRLGRICYSIFTSLGYRLIVTKSPFVRYNALGLLAYGKIWLDWYSQSAYMDSNLVSKLEVLFKRSSLDGYELTIDDLVSIFSSAWHVNYDGDYFTSAFDNPVAPNSNNFTSFVLPDVTIIGDGNGVSNDNFDNGTPSFIPDNSITKYQLDALNALSDYMKRNQISGSRAVDRYLARFGVNLSSEIMQRSIYLGNMMIDINFGDVMSHADTSTTDVSNLGDYAGRGDGVGNKVVEYDTRGEYGVLISVMSILPNGGYVQGYDRNNLHVDKGSFWTPEYDSLGVMSVEKGELYVSKNVGFSNTGSLYRNTFGFLPTYAEYKVGRSFVTGDYACDSVNAGKDAWHLNRLFSDSSFGDISGVVHSLDFTLGSDALQYNRIFTYTGPAADHFNIVAHFNVDCIAPCKSLFDTYEFQEKGKSVELESNGVKLN